MDIFVLIQLGTKYVLKQHTAIYDPHPTTRDIGTWLTEIVVILLKTLLGPRCSLWELKCFPLVPVLGLNSQVWHGLGRLWKLGGETLKEVGNRRYILTSYSATYFLSSLYMLTEDARWPPASRSLHEAKMDSISSLGPTITSWVVSVRALITAGETNTGCVSHFTSPNLQTFPFQTRHSSEDECGFTSCLTPSHNYKPHSAQIWLDLTVNCLTTS